MTEAAALMIGLVAGLTIGGFVGLYFGMVIASFHFRSPMRFPDLGDLRLADHTTWPTEPFWAVIENEWVRVTLSKGTPDDPGPGGL